MSETHSTPAHKARAVLAILVLLLCIGAAGVGVWYGFFRDDSRQIVVITNPDGSPTTRGIGAMPDFTPRTRGGPRNFNNGNNNRYPVRAATRAAMAARAVYPPGVSEQPNGSFIIRSGAIYMHVPRAVTDPREVSLQYLRNELLTPEQQRFGEASWRVTHDSATAEFLKVAPEQVALLLKVEPPLLKVEAQDRERLKDLWNAYVAAAQGADKASAEKALLAGLDAVVGRVLPALKEDVGARFAQIKAVLSAEQVDRYVQGLSGAAPATAPAGPATQPSASARRAARPAVQPANPPAGGQGAVSSSGSSAPR